jgi:hypothetical protein
MRAAFFALLSGAVLLGSLGLADDDAATQTGESLSIDGEPLNPRGRYSDTLVRQTPRYYVWQDTEGWHLRTASQRGRLIRFQGTIKVTGGTISKLREVGLERRGSGADTWTVSEDRTQVEFEIATTSSFDGFDFTITGADAQLEFDLSMGKRQFPKRIYIGRDGQHPAETKFTLAANRPSE